MIVQEFYLEDWDWYVIVYYAVDTYYVSEILGELEEIGCSEYELKEAEKNLMTARYNIGLTSSPAQFQNTFDHEKGHLAMHICIESDIDPFSEEYQYLTGEIGQQMFPVAKNFLCEHCRLKLKGEDN